MSAVYHCGYVGYEFGIAVEFRLKAGVFVAVVDDEDDDEDVGTVPLGKVLLVKSISRMRDSMGVLPTNRTKKISLMTWELTSFNAGRRRSNLPKRFICDGY